MLPSVRVLGPTRPLQPGRAGVYRRHFAGHRFAGAGQRQDRRNAGLRAGRPEGRRRAEARRDPGRAARPHEPDRTPSYYGVKNGDRMKLRIESSLHAGAGRPAGAGRRRQQAGSPSRHRRRQRRRSGPCHVGGTVEAMTCGRCNLESDNLDDLKFLTTFPLFLLWSMHYGKG